ncbi:hypothetical protein DYY65_10400 [Nitrososphaera sp. AFS]|nr:hypothetical protein [Nitrososphaera sp. AFS]
MKLIQVLVFVQILKLQILKLCCLLNKKTKVPQERNQSLKKMTSLLMNKYASSRRVYKRIMGNHLI